MIRLRIVFLGGKGLLLCVISPVAGSTAICFKSKYVISSPVLVNSSAKGYGCIGVR